ncbi:hypothetical protein Ciccas_004932 [Cichlidogyrus casuarinus]|uniref:Uncharacterized protein n=1 Tax=Cichlidogyrus casuarinus TaxID=1844966 RepID=A0ABD2QA47_9PLAT
MKQSKPMEVVNELQGMSICASSEVLDRDWQIEFINSQVMLRLDEESSGFVIVCAARARLNSLMHPPVWRESRLLAKQSLIGRLDCMRYFATMDSYKPDQGSQWLLVHTIASCESEAPVPTASSSVGSYDEEGNTGRIELQCMIPKCSCEVYYVSYEPADVANISHVPPLVSLS